MPSFASDHDWRKGRGHGAEYGNLTSLDATPVSALCMSQKRCAQRRQWGLRQPFAIYCVRDG
jgi:hypothetical protein